MSEKHLSERNAAAIEQIAARLRMPVAEDLSKLVPSELFTKRISIAHARAHRVIGFRGKRSTQAPAKSPSPNAGADVQAPRIES